MASKNLASLALFLSLSILFFALAIASDCGCSPSPKPRPVPSPNPTPVPSPNPTPVPSHKPTPVPSHKPTPLPPTPSKPGSSPTPGSSGTPASPGTPSSPGSPSSSRSCPRDTLQLGACANVLSGLLNLQLSQPPSQQCCSLLQGLADIDAAVCLCTALRANVLGINLNVPISLSLLLNVCDKKVPSNFQCS